MAGCVSLSSVRVVSESRSRRTLCSQEGTSSFRMLGASETAAAAVGFPFLLVDLPPAAPVTLDFDWSCWREKTLLDSRRATINCPMMPSPRQGGSSRRTDLDAGHRFGRLHHPRQYASEAGGLFQGDRVAHEGPGDGKAEGRPTGGADSHTLSQKPTPCTAIGVARATSAKLRPEPRASG
jgi:hypothetical protein